MPLSKPFYAAAIYEEVAAGKRSQGQPVESDPKESGEPSTQIPEAKATPELDVKKSQRESATAVNLTKSDFALVLDDDETREKGAAALLLKLSEEAIIGLEDAEFKSALDLVDSTLEKLQSNLSLVKDDSCAGIIKETTSFLDLNPRDLDAIKQRARAYEQFQYYTEALEDFASACFLESFGNRESVSDVLRLLEKIATFTVGSQELGKSSVLADYKKSYPVKSHLSVFMNDPISQAWKSGEENKIIKQQVNKFFSSTNEEPLLADAKTGKDGWNSNGYRIALDNLLLEKYSDILNHLTNEISLACSAYIPESYLFRGTLSHLWGDGEGALRDYNSVISHEEATNEQISAAWIKKGLYYSEESGQNRATKSILCFRKAEALCPDNPDIYFANAQVQLLRFRDLAKAEDQIQKACTLAPNFELFEKWKLYIRLRIASKRHGEEGIQTALLEFQPPLGFSDKPEILRVEICVLAWMCHGAEAHAKLDQWAELEKDNPRVFLAKLLLHEVICNNSPFDLLEDTLLNYGRCAHIQKQVGKYAYSTGLLEAAAECFQNSLQLTQNYEDKLSLVKLEKAAITFSRVVSKFNLVISDYVKLMDYETILVSFF